MRESVVTDALLLRAVDYGERDRIVTLFTSERGKLSALARSAKASRRRFAGALEPYTVIRVELESGHGELFALRRAEIVQVFPALLSELGRIEVAAAALTLLREAHPAQVPDVQAFMSTVQFLTLLEHESDAERAALLAFAMRVLALAGLAPRLSTCGRSDVAVPAGKAAYFDPVLGALIAKRFGGGPFLLSWAVRERLLLAQGERWLDAARAPWPPELLLSARCALSAFIASHLSPDLAGRLFPGS